MVNRTDRLLKVKGIKFLRYADDYHIFSKTKEEAYRNLTELSKLLLTNEGLTLQKSKTRIMSTDEYILNSDLYKVSKDSSEKAKFMQISLRFDPYSDDPEGEYEELKEQVEKFDILGILKTEITSKTLIHKQLVSNLVKAVRFLEKTAQKDAIITMLKNLHSLAPVFNQIMMTIRKVIGDLERIDQEEICDNLISKYQKNDYLFQIELNLHYVTLVLGTVNRDENAFILNDIFEKKISSSINRDIILIMAKWNNSDWLGNIRTKFLSLSLWEKKSFIVGSYRLADEGSHWRSNSKSAFSASETLAKKWASSHVDAGTLEGFI